MPSPTNLRLSADRLLRPRVWEREVRAAIRKHPNLYEAAEALEVDRDTLLRWRKLLGIPDGSRGRKKRANGVKKST